MGQSVRLEYRPTFEPGWPGFRTHCHLCSWSYSGPTAILLKSCIVLDCLIDCGCLTFVSAGLGRRFGRIFYMLRSKNRILENKNRECRSFLSGPPVKLHFVLRSVLMNEPSDSYLFFEFTCLKVAILGTAIYLTFHSKKRSCAKEVKEKSSLWVQVSPHLQHGCVRMPTWVAVIPVAHLRATGMPGNFVAFDNSAAFGNPITFVIPDASSFNHCCIGLYTVIHVYAWKAHWTLDHMTALDSVERRNASQQNQLINQSMWAGGDPLHKILCRILPRCGLKRLKLPEFLFDRLKDFFLGKLIKLLIMQNAFYYFFHRKWAVIGGKSLGRNQVATRYFQRKFGGQRRDFARRDWSAEKMTALTKKRLGI